MFNDLMREVIVHFVGIDGIVDHHFQISFLKLSLNPVHVEVFSIQHYVIKFVSDLRQVDKTDRHNINEIL
jgi:hypothetical protein